MKTWILQVASENLMAALSQLGIVAIWRLPLQHVPGCPMYDRVGLQYIPGHREDDVWLKTADDMTKDSRSPTIKAKTTNWWLKIKGKATNCSFITLPNFTRMMLLGRVGLFKSRPIHSSLYRNSFFYPIKFSKYDLLTSEHVPGLR